MKLSFNHICVLSTFDFLYLCVNVGTMIKIFCNRINNFCKVGIPYRKKKKLCKKNFFFTLIEKRRLKLFDVFG